MGRLLDLLAENGKTAEEAAIAGGVLPLLVRRIDAGEQPLPRVLRHSIASLLGIAEERVAEACTLVTYSTDAIVLNAIPPRLGEPVPAARIAATEPVFATGGSPPTPGDTRQLFVFFDSPGSPNESTIIDEVAVDSNGSIAETDYLTDSNEDGILGSSSGLLVPPAAPTALIVTDRATPAIWLLDPTNFALVSSFNGEVGSSQALAWDPVNEFPWLANSGAQEVVRLDPDGDFTTPLASIATTAGSPFAVCFLDGPLYAICGFEDGGDMDWKVVQVRTTPGIEGVTLVSSVFTSVGTNMQGYTICSAASVPDAVFTPGDPGFIIEWDIVGGDTPSITPTPIALGGLPVVGTVQSLIYDAVNDCFWGHSETSFFRCSVTGFVDFVDEVGSANPTVPILVPSLNLAITVGSTGSKSVRCYSAQPPVLLTSTPVGVGPNPVGQNYQPLSFALRPPP